MSYCKYTLKVDKTIYGSYDKYKMSFKKSYVHMFHFKKIYKIPLQLKYKK